MKNKREIQPLLPFGWLHPGDAHSEGHWKETAKITMGKSAVYFRIRGKVPQTTAVIGK